MKMILLITGILLLVINLRGYKNLFKGNEHTKENLLKTLNQAKSKAERQFYKQLMLIFYLLLGVVSVTFHILASISIDSDLILVIAALNVVLVILGFIKLANILADEDTKHIKWYDKISTPINTLYYIYVLSHVLIFM